MTDDRWSAQQCHDHEVFMHLVGAKPYGAKPITPAEARRYRRWWRRYWRRAVLRWRLLWD